MREALAAVLAEPSLLPGPGLRIADATTRCFGVFAIIPASSFRSISSPTGFAARLPFSTSPRLWPQSVIVMTLAKVGSAAGPDFERLAEIKAKAGSRDVIAAGGVRNEADIRALSALGIAAALVATSLHDGTLTPGQLASLGLG